MVASTLKFATINNILTSRSGCPANNVSHTCIACSLLLQFTTQKLQLHV